MKLKSADELNVYLISLEKDFKRREELQKKMPECYRNINWIKAIDGGCLLAKDYFFYSNQYYRKNKKLITPSEVGCTLSHMQAYKEFLLTNEEYCLIIEDDIIGGDEKILKIKKIIHDQKPDGLVLFGGQEGLPRDYYDYMFFKEYKDLYLISEFSKRFMIRAHCYAINRDVARYLINFHEKNFQVADHWSILLKNKKMYYLELVKHPNDLTNSNIENERSIFYICEKNILKRVLKEGFFKKIYNRVYNDLFSIIVSLSGFKRLKKYKNIK